MRPGDVFLARPARRLAEVLLAPPPNWLRRSTRPPRMCSNRAGSPQRRAVGSPPSG